MRIPVKFAIFAAAMALSVAPALAAGRPSGTSIPTNSGTSHMPSNPGSQGTSHTSTPGPSASFPAKAKAYGKDCQGTSKQHTAGQKGTAFSMCVTDMAKFAHSQSKTAKSACSNESKQTAAGQSRSAFSLCVSAGAKLRHQQQND